MGGTQHLTPNKPDDSSPSMGSNHSQVLRFCKLFLSLLTGPLSLSFLHTDKGILMETWSCSGKLGKDQGNLGPTFLQTLTVAFK
jgi:hypothetical protein